MFTEIAQAIAIIAEKAVVLLPWFSRALKPFSCGPLEEDYSNLWANPHLQGLWSDCGVMKDWCGSLVITCHVVIGWRFWHLCECV